MKADILAFGAHPDDIEVACGGTLAAAVQQGKQVVAIDLTRGEMGTRGCAATRLAEANRAAGVLGLAARENLGMADAFFTVDEAHIRAVVTCIRQYRPTTIFCNPFEDRHPDHVKAAGLVTLAASYAARPGLVTYSNGQRQEPWTTGCIFHYIQHRFLEPDVVLDISACVQQKQAAVLAYDTQFNCPAALGEPATYISDPAFMHLMHSRAALLGRRIGVAYAEGFLSSGTTGSAGFDSFTRHLSHYS